MRTNYLNRSEPGDFDRVYALREDMVLVANPGTENEFEAGSVWDAENFETACDAADEESRVLMAQARAEFGF